MRTNASSIYIRAWNSNFTTWFQVGIPRVGLSASIFQIGIPHHKKICLHPYSNLAFFITRRSVCIHIPTWHSTSQDDLSASIFQLGILHHKMICLHPYSNSAFHITRRLVCIHIPTWHSSSQDDLSASIFQLGIPHHKKICLHPYSNLAFHITRRSVCIHIQTWHSTLCERVVSIQIPTLYSISSLPRLGIPQHSQLSASIPTDVAHLDKISVTSLSYVTS